MSTRPGQGTEVSARRSQGCYEDMATLPGTVASLGSKKYPVAPAAALKLVSNSARTGSVRLDSSSALRATKRVQTRRQSQTFRGQRQRARPLATASCFTVAHLRGLLLSACLTPLFVQVAGMRPWGCSHLHITCASQCCHQLSIFLAQCYPPEQPEQPEPVISLRAGKHSKVCHWKPIWRFFAMEKLLSYVCTSGACAVCIIPRESSRRRLFAVCVTVSRSASSAGSSTT